ncbi:MAG TPA: hypothetical protein PLS23_23045 [Phycisphaerae bacterium]|nr:hypothetical protein [Phycisphaerae bacterium]
MSRTDQQLPRTRPSLHYFRPYRQTVIGAVCVAALVGLLIAAVQLLVGV